MSRELPSAYPSLPGRIVELIPLGYDKSGHPVHETSRDALIEGVIVELDTGQVITGFVPDLYFDRDYIGARCLLEFAAGFGDYRTLKVPGNTGLSIASNNELTASGEITSLYRDGIVLDVGSGAIGVREIDDDRFEPGRIMEASRFRFDFKRILAVESSTGGWIASEQIPFVEPLGALEALRKGEVTLQRIPAIELDDDLKRVRDYESAYATLQGEPLATLVYRLGEADLREAEPDVVALLSHEDHSVRLAAVWVLSRYWHMTEYRARFMDIAENEKDGRLKTRAVIGIGILARASHDSQVTSFLLSLMKDKRIRWYVREAAYLALLGVWLPETALVREVWRSWKNWSPPEGERKPRSWDAWAKQHVDWDFVSSVQRKTRR